MKVAIIVAHPDDETLGCGATIANHIEKGDEIYILTLSNGVSSRQEHNEADIKTRQTAFLNATQQLGISPNNLTSLDFPDNEFDTVSLLKIAQAIELFLSKNIITRVYTHYHSDLNVDHRKTYEAVLTACRPQPMQSVKQIFCFETLSSTEWASHRYEAFKPNYFVNIEHVFSKKIKALTAYKDEMREAPHTRSLENIQALAKFRGMCVGTPLAEAFYIERLID